MMNIFKRIRIQRITTKQEHDDPGSQKGQSLVEMAIMMVVLLIILGGVLDLGRMYFTYLALQNAAGEGAAYGAINPEWEDNGDNADPDNITYRVQTESTGSLIDWSNTLVDVTVPTIAGGSPLTVSVTYTYTVITPMIQVITGEEVRLRATDTQLIFLTEDDD
jgi:Flp pilus assembly protein TadG